MPARLMHTEPLAGQLLNRLDGIRENGPGQWVVRCPAHEDKNPSLSIRDLGDRVLVHCFAGCDTSDVMEAVGLSLSDLFACPLEHHRGSVHISKRCCLPSSSDICQS